MLLSLSLSRYILLLFRKLINQGFKGIARFPNQSLNVNIGNVISENYHNLVISILIRGGQVSSRRYYFHGDCNTFNKGGDREVSCRRRCNCGERASGRERLSFITPAIPRCNVFQLITTSAVQVGAGDEKGKNGEWGGGRWSKIRPR